MAYKSQNPDWYKNPERGFSRGWSKNVSNWHLIMVHIFTENISSHDNLCIKDDD